MRRVYSTLAVFGLLLTTSGTCNSPQNGIPDGAVDLGIVMTREDGTTYKLYWAKSNLCEKGLCTNPEDIGDKYAWGETRLKSIYDWSNYKYGASFLGPFSKYNFADRKVVLETGKDGDDAASKKLGGKWRMPTENEWQALIDNCTWTLTNNYHGTGIGGIIGTSKVPGYSDRGIFFPGVYYPGESGEEGYWWGDYWTSSLPVLWQAESESDWWVFCSATSISFPDVMHDNIWVDFFSINYNMHRSMGLSIRPVSE